MNQSRSTVHLEEIRINQGEEACIKQFRDTAKKSRQEAVNLINDRTMTYPCLFALIPSIEEFNLQQKMVTKYAIAMEVSKQVLREDYIPRKDYLKYAGEKAHEALEWVLMTGYKEEFSKDSYQKVLDIVSSVLIHVYKNQEILPVLAEFIFERRKRGENVHDLIWAYFRSHTPNALKLIADKLPSADSAEADFIYDLLGIIHTEPTNTAQEYEKYLAWLNKAEIVFNEENKQYTSRPVVCPVGEIKKGESLT